jgi:nucleotide-binding universal stress UspA family protein
MKIVVPLDLSDVSARAIEPAADIARGVGDELLLVTVAGARLRSDLRHTAESEGVDIVNLIEQHLQSTAHELSGIDVQTKLISGDDAASSLVDFAESQTDLRMIVMATHGRTGMERWRLGNVTEKVVRHSTVPVLVIPTRGKG